jgi:TolA-binding protein
MRMSTRLACRLGIFLIVLVWQGAPLAFAQQSSAATSEAARQQYAAAVALQNRELYDTAAQEWAAFLQKFPNDPRADRAQHYLGVCQYQDKKYPEAIASFEKVIRQYPKFELLETTHYSLALAHYSQAQAGQPEAYDRAAAAFAALVTKFPKGQFAAEALYYQGESKFAGNQPAEAAALYARLVKEFPKSKLVPDALYALGVAQQTQEKPADAAATFATFLQQFPQHRLGAEVMMRRGESLVALGQTAEGEKLLAAAAASAGFEHADNALLAQAAAQAANKRYAQAAATYSSLTSKFPQSKLLPSAELGAGRSFYLAGEYDQARQWLAKTAARGGAAATEAAHWIARSHLKQGQPADALRVVEQALPAAQGEFAAQLALDKADALYDIADRRDEAVAAYADVARRFPQDALAGEALYQAAFTALGQGDYQTALDHARSFQRDHGEHRLAADVAYVAAEAQLLLKQFAPAQQAYRALLEKYPQHADAPQWRLRHGLSLYLEQKYDETIKALGQALPTLKTPDAIAEAHYLIGASHSELGRHQPAVASLKASLAAKADWRQADETLLILAQSHKQLGDLPAAMAAARQLVDRFPNSKWLDRAHYRLGEYAYASNDYKTAAAEYQRVVLKWPNSSVAPHALLGLGWSQLSQQQYADAEKTLTTFLEGYGKSDLAARGRYARALARQQLKRFEPAIEDLQAFLSSQPADAERADALYVLGLCQAGAKRPAEAAKTYQQLIADFPQYAGADKAYYELAWTQKELGQHDKAAETFARLAKQYPNSPLTGESLYHVGEQRYGDEEFKAASVAYYDAMQKAGKSDLGEKAAHKLGWAYFRQDAFDKAQQSFAYQRATFPQGSLAADAAFMEAESLLKQNKFAEALAAYEQVKNPSSEEFAALALLHAGQAAAQLKQWQKSLELLEQAVQQYPEAPSLPEMLYEQAFAQQHLGRTDEAMKLYEQVTAQTNREVAARARFMIGEIQFEKKEHAEAVRNFYKVAYGYGYPEWQANALYEAARCLEVLKKTDQARKDYQEIVTKFPDSDKAPLAKQRLAELGR